jgi:RNA polymerase sigma-70 factor, ECF subfamily
VHRAFGIALLTVTAAGITRITLWGEPALVERFVYPLDLGAGSAEVQQ